MEKYTYIYIFSGINGPCLAHYLVFELKRVRSSLVNISFIPMALMCDSGVILLEKLVVSHP